MQLPEEETELDEKEPTQETNKKIHFSQETSHLEVAQTQKHELLITN